ncbi:MAG: hypothetical protein N4A72_00075 [Bacteroidales bacterium]|jgi:hypothetical protein|nr:hypothetical protein [Bacteroidales bacterium]
MKIRDRILITIACIIGAVEGEIEYEYKREVLIGLLIFTVIDHCISIIRVFRNYTLLQTSYDIIFRAGNLVLGCTMVVFFIISINHLLYFAWFFLLFAFISLTNAIVYQYSIQLRKRSETLIINYKQRRKITIKYLDSVILRSDKIILSEQERVVEINDLKNTEKNRTNISDFFKENYPDIRLIME